KRSRCPRVWVPQASNPMAAIASSAAAAAAMAAAAAVRCASSAGRSAARAADARRIKPSAARRSPQEHCRAVYFPATFDKTKFQRKKRSAIGQRPADIAFDAIAESPHAEARAESL